MAQLLQKLRSLRNARRHRGTATVEAAIVMTLVLLVTFAMCDWGLYFWRWQEITNACRQGARNGALSSAVANCGTNATVCTTINTLMGTTGYNFTGYTWTGSSQSTWVTITTPGSVNISALTRGQLFTVKLSVPYADLNSTGVSGILSVGHPAYLYAAVSMEKEGS